MSIRSFCEQFVQRKGINITTFSALLGYRSVNSLYRIMDDKVRSSSLLDFSQKLTTAFELTMEERSALKDAIYAKQFGDEKSCYFTAINEFLCNPRLPTPSQYTTADSLFHDIYHRYHALRELKIIILNCLDAAALAPIHDLLQEGATVVQYLHHRITSLDLFRSLDILSTIMFYPKYTCFAQQTDSGNSRMLQGKDRADLLWCSYTADDGIQHVDMIEVTLEGAIFHPDIRLHVPTFSDDYIPLKKQWLDAVQLRDYPTFGRKCAELDRDRTTYKLKADLTYAEISGDRWAGLFRNGPMASQPQFEQALGILTNIYNERFYNSMHKKKHTWHVMKLSAMEVFMQTGRISDHMWAMRPFTPQERREVLQDLLNHCHNNHFRHLLLLKDDSLSDSLEFDLYDGYCLLFQNANTNYDLSNTHGEYVLIHPTLLRWFKEYFFQVIVKTMCYSEAQSMDMLNHLLEIHMNDK